LEKGKWKEGGKKGKEGERKGGGEHNSTDRD
jgi:hypothetical protein